MINVLRAAIGRVEGRLAIVDPSRQALGAASAWRGEVILVSPTPRSARRSASWADTARREDLLVSAVLGSSPTLPISPRSLDALLNLEPLPSNREEAVARLEGLRRYLKPGASLVLVSSIAEGVMGSATSFIKRTVRSSALPRAWDLTEWMLRAGTRPVRQASVKGLVAPSVVTWARVEPRPWE